LATHPIERFADRLELPECPRWHDGSLFVSDMWGHAVWRFSVDGTRQLVHRFADDEDPGGLGWLPGGDLLVVGMEGRCVHRIDATGTVRTHADLSPLAPGTCNDMIVAADGTAYVSHFGYDFWRDPAGARAASLLRVGPEGAVDVVVDDLLAPNGMAMSPDGRTLFLSECGRSTILAFDRADDGTLHRRRPHAVIAPAPGRNLAPPDGICIDEAGGVWAAEPIGKRVLRFDADGARTDEIAYPHAPLAVVLGGEDRRTLFVCVSPQHDKPNRDPEVFGYIDALRVEVPGIGRP
jgi:sugar lactone lactonase YvrE